jgi:hypothetical protein
MGARGKPAGVGTLRRRQTAASDPICDSGSDGALEAGNRLAAQMDRTYGDDDRLVFRDSREYAEILGHRPRTHIHGGRVRNHPAGRGSLDLPA